MTESNAITAKLRRIDGEPWGRYRDLIGSYTVREFELCVDGVPPDPFAGPARIRLRVKREDSGLPDAWFDERWAKIAVEDWLGREAMRAISRQSLNRDPGPGRGSVRIQSPGASVVERCACRWTPTHLELRLLVDLPARNRRILGRVCNELLRDELPKLAHATLVVSSQRLEQLRTAVLNVADHRALQSQLRERGLVAFVGEGSLLARAAGDETGPRKDGLEQPLRVPDDLAVELEDATGNKVRGLGIPGGVTLIVGGAFHGKSTLLNAIALGIHPKPLGDGRERVVTDPDAIVNRAEDGRVVHDLDLSAFFDQLPTGMDAQHFSTPQASGSTSQAAALIEGLESGATLLLIDEDKSATNFMIRDGRMQRLVPKGQESVIPFIDRVQELYRERGISTLLVTGGSGDYLEVADTVIQMRDYQPVRRTEDARQIAAETRTMRLDESRREMTPLPTRTIEPHERSRKQPGRGGARGQRSIKIDRRTIELDGLEQLSEEGQTRTLAQLLREWVSGKRERCTLREWLDLIEQRFDAQGLDDLERAVSYEFSRPRRHEIAAALNRWRDAKITQSGS